MALQFSGSRDELLKKSGEDLRLGNELNCQRLQHAKGQGGNP